VREKKRYLVVRLFARKEFDEVLAKRLVYEAVFQLLGEFGASRAAVQLKGFDAGRQELLLKCAASELEGVVAALALKRFFGGEGVALRVSRVSGSVAGTGFAGRGSEKQFYK
jgi:RNase P/RNase MRP subunit POP5